MCQGNTKKLYEAFNSMTGKTVDNPMPEGKSDEELANECAEYFISKIDNIRDSLKDVPLYVPSENKKFPKLEELSEITELDVKNIINTLATKSCELDIIPTKLLKKVLDHLLPTITKIINMSLHKGLFVPTWITAVIRPLLKKTGLDF